MGLAFGLAAGYMRGIVDILITRLGEVFAVFPDILLLLIIAATIRPRIKTMAYAIEDNTFISGIVSSGAIDYIVLGIAFLPLSWFGTMRLIRGQTLVVRDAPVCRRCQVDGGAHAYDSGAPCVAQYHQSAHRECEFRYGRSGIGRSDSEFLRRWSSTAADRVWV